MKILLSADTVGGVWTFALELARALSRQKVEIVLATMGAPLSPEQRAQVTRLSHVQVFESRYKLEWMDDPWLDVARAGDWLLDVERQVRPDIIHLNGTLSHGALAWQRPVLVAAHSCVTSWWQAVKNEAAPPAWNHYRHEVTRGLHAADLVIAPTRALLAMLETNYGPLPRTDIVPNGRDASRFAPVGQKQPFVLAAGRLWDEAKNIGALAQVAPGLPWPVYVAGEAERPGGGGGTEGAGATNLHFLGRLASECLAGYLSRAAVYALPARYEPFGLSVLEAGLAGCALVLGDLPSLREVWGDDAALFVPPDDRDALRNALCRLIARPAEREHLAARARERALAFSPERMARGYLAAYAALTPHSNANVAGEVRA